MVQCTLALIFRVSVTHSGTVNMSACVSVAVCV